VTTYTPTTWAQRLLGLLGVPVTDANTSAIVAWEQAEGGHWGNPDRFNPLNTTMGEPGAVSTNSAGVKAYTSWDQGLTATVSTLTNGAYAGVLDALRRGDSAQSVVSAVVRSPWGTKSISLNGGTYNPSSPAGTAAQASYASDLGFPNLGNLAIMGGFLVGGVALVVLGLWRGTASGRQAVEAKAQKTAATAAMVGA
jgi:hypothetical protein